MTGGHSRLGANDRGSFSRGVTQDYDTEFSSISVRLRNPCERPLKIADLRTTSTYSRAWCAHDVRHTNITRTSPAHALASRRHNKLMLGSLRLTPIILRGYKCRQCRAAHSSAACTGMFGNVMFCCVLLLGAAAGVLGSHFRGGIIMVRPQPGGNETEVRPK